MHDDLIARLDRALDRLIAAYWAVGSLVWSLFWLAAWLTDLDIANRNHLFLVALIHWAARDILAALRASGQGEG